MHSMLMRQLRQNAGLADPGQVQETMAGLAALAARVGADDPRMGHLLASLEALLAAVDASYQHLDREADLLRRSLDLTSSELLSAKECVERELSAKSRALDALRTTLLDLLGPGESQHPATGEDDIDHLATRLAQLARERERMHIHLQERERRYRGLYEGLIDALFVCEITPDNKMGRFIEVNEVACRRLGYTRKELLTLSPHDIRAPDTTIDFEQLTEELLAGQSVTVTHVHLTKGGRRIPVEVHAHMIRLLGKTAFLALARDITDRVHAEEQLRLWASVFEASNEGIVITDSQQCIVSANRAVTEITGYAAEEILGQTPRLFSSGKHGMEFYRRMWEAVAAEGCWQGEIWDRRKNGDLHPKWMSLSAVRNLKNEITHYIGTFSDISERKASEERIRFLAYHDPLTALPNRLLLRDRFEQEIAHARSTNSRVALLFLDLDRFKTINDSLGHPVGDKLLQAIAQRLKYCLRETDTISRAGGDEFVIILADRYAIENLTPIIDKLLERLNEPFEINGNILHTSFSIGVSFFPEDGKDFDTLLQKADTAMYRVKEAGRNSYRYFTDEMNAAAIEQMRMENSLRKALERHEFRLHYQPQVDLATGRLIGVEALLRWNSPELGMVPPARFIPIAEESGLIVSIGDWVLREACRQAQFWRNAGHGDFTVAVNLSAVQFRHGDLVGMVCCALSESGLEPALLELELTESIMIQGAETVLATVQRLKALGVQLSIDDFGTGYSSLSYLKRFNVDRLKIDQSFVRGLPDDPDDPAIVRAVIQMCHSLKLSVIAEGVETEAQARFLRLAGCNLAQGYLFGGPQTDPLHTRLLAAVS